MKNMLKSNSGMTLALVVIIFSVVAILGTIILTLSLSQTSQAKASEENTAAYYYARSAVEIVSTQIDKKELAYQQALEDWMNNPPENGELSQECQDALDALHLYVPENTGSLQLTLDGVMSSGPVTVTVTKAADGKVDIVATAENDMGFSGAKLRLGTFTETEKDGYEEETTYTAGMFGDDTLFSWSIIDVKNPFDVYTPDAAIARKITAQGKVIIDKENNENQFDSGITVTEDAADRNAPIIMPPDDYGKNGSNIYNSSTLTTTRAILPGDSGYYGTLAGKDMKNVNWKVNTTDGDVILVFDSIAAEGLTITVEGSNNLYIYIQEPYDINNGTVDDGAGNLLQLSNQCSIINIDGYDKKGNPIYSASQQPKTYFIIATDYLQDYANTAGASVIPGAQLEKQAVLDHVDIDNNTNKGMSAYFYAPGCSIDISNNSFFYGSIYASSLSIAGNGEIMSYPIDFNNLTDDPTTSGQDTYTTTKTIYSNYIDVTVSDTDRMWLKYKGV